MKTYSEKGFSKESGEALDVLYSKQQAEDFQSKLRVIEEVIGRGVAEFAAYGGTDNDETKLAALEFEYLMELGLEHAELA